MSRFLLLIVVFALAACAGNKVKPPLEVEYERLDPLVCNAEPKINAIDLNPINFVALYGFEAKGRDYVQAQSATAPQGQLFDIWVGLSVGDYSVLALNTRQIMGMNSDLKGVVDYLKSCIRNYNEGNHTTKVLVDVPTASEPVCTGRLWWRKCD